MSLAQSEEAAPGTPRPLVEAATGGQGSPRGPLPALRPPTAPSTPLASKVEKLAAS